MENRGSKVVAIVALCVGVVGLSLGFAAFSNTLTISSSATVSPSADTFNVVFADGQVSCTTENGASAVAGTASGRSISGIQASFTAPGQSVTCTATINNAGEYEAFLNSIAAGKVTCSSEDATITTDLMNAACDSIVVTASVGAETPATAFATTKDAMASDFSEHSLAAGKSETVTLKIAYNGPARADGTFAVAVPQVTLTYSSVD